MQVVKMNTALESTKLEKLQQESEFLSKLEEHEKQTAHHYKESHAIAKEMVTVKSRLVTDEVISKVQ